MHKLAETLTNPVASYLVPPGKSSMTVQEGSFPHAVVADDTFVCLNYEKIALKTSKAICNALC